MKIRLARAKIISSRFAERKPPHENEEDKGKALTRKAHVYFRDEEVFAKARNNYKNQL